MSFVVCCGESVLLFLVLIKRSFLIRSSVRSTEYTPHHDFSMPALVHGQPSRFATILFYLNDDMEGGETSFPLWLNAETTEELKVKPERGKAVLFYSLLPDGNYDERSMHAAMPVTKGEKVCISIQCWDVLECKCTVLSSRDSYDFLVVYAVSHELMGVGPCDGPVSFIFVATIVCRRTMLTTLIVPLTRIRLVLLRDTHDSRFLIIFIILALYLNVPLSLRARTTFYT